MIRDLHNKLLNQEITSEKLTEDYFANIEKKDPEIKAYISLNKEFALDKARAVDKKIKNGEEIDLLAGVPCAIKDNICIEGLSATAGSKILENYISPYDATVIKKLKESDAIFLGKTNMDEFAMGSSTENSAYQITKNPHDTLRVPGGSSGGSAAAVAADECVWALGSDTGGSIRQPASFCGAVGLKSTYGMVSRYGLIAMASSLDQIGPIAKTVEDAAIILSRLAGKDRFDSTTIKTAGKKYEDFLGADISGLKIGIPKEYFASVGLDKNVEKKIREAATKFEKLGAKIVDVSLPSSDFALATYYIIMPSEVSSNLARFDGIRFGKSVGAESEKTGEDLTLGDIYFKTRAKYLGREVKRRIMLGTYALSAGYYDQYYKKAQKVRALIKKEFEDAFKKVDLILGPTAPTPAFKIGEKTARPLEMYLADIYTVTANIAGLPAISVPCGTISEDGKELPVGMQLMGKWFGEEILLNAAYIFENS
ncbi:MAG: aspartyl/glutamyl-tRNA amidotransferase subunit A [Candidatus Moranbacteria bacterium RBG_13_45_13]|nr:MAG: aspartyl/glutamyl-tRNA amidotransferase subunit A [Candidatus Moranbacteria bacterium RBG_13_45_13]